MDTINLKRLRKENDLSQQDLADYLEIGQGYVSQMERGDRPVSKAIIEKIKAHPVWTIHIEKVENHGTIEVKQEGRKKIPLYDDVVTMGGKNDMLANVEDESRSMEYVDAGEWFQGATSAIHHYGDSMIEYPSGSILVLKRVNDMRLLINGEHYVIETDEFRITKQIQDDGEDYIMAYSSNMDTYPDGHLIHSPIKIPKETIRHMDLVLGCVVRRFGNRTVRVVR